MGSLALWGLCHLSEEFSNEEILEPKTQLLICFLPLPQLLSLHLERKAGKKTMVSKSAVSRETTAYLGCFLKNV